MIRVVSLVPSSTETLLSLGVEVIACTKFCEQPDIAHVGGTKNPDLDAIAALGPDLVVMDREENRIEDHDAMRRCGLEVYVSDVRSLSDAIEVVAELRAVTGAASARDPETIPPRSAGRRRTAFVPIWRRPWMTTNGRTYGASVLEHLGVDLVTASDPDPYPTVDLDEVVASAPDLVLVPSEPYAFTDAHVDELRTSFPTATVRRVDGQDLFWWGVRTPAALRRLAVALHDGGTTPG